jgi:hypothetical protein
MIVTASLVLYNNNSEEFKKTLNCVLKNQSINEFKLFVIVNQHNNILKKKEH